MRTKAQIESLVKDRIPHTGRDSYSHIIIELSEQLLQAMEDKEKEKADNFLAGEVNKLRLELKSLKSANDNLKAHTHRVELLVDLLEKDRDNCKDCH